MKARRKTALIATILLIGGLLIGLAYLFHPDSGPFAVLINGRPVAEPLARIAVLPTLIVLLSIMAFLMLLVFFGVGLLLFAGALLLAVIGIGVVAPFLWPLLVIVLAAVILASLGAKMG
jgi:hypothetical protein